MEKGVGHCLVVWITATLVVCVLSQGDTITSNVNCIGQFSLYADSALQGTGTPSQPDLTVDIPADTAVVAVECTLSGEERGMLAAIGDTIITDGSWKCNTEYEEGWQGSGFDDSTWPQAAPVYVGVPVVVNPPEYGDAVMIWTSGFTEADLQVYCRRMMTKRGRPDNQGTEFVILFMENPDGGSSKNLELFITTAKPYEVAVSVTTPRHPVSLHQRLLLQAGQVEQVVIPRQLAMIGTSRGMHTVLVTASDEVAVYGANKQLDSVGAFLAKPVDVLGGNYYATCYSPATRKTQIGVVAPRDATTVRVTLPDVAGMVVDFMGVSYTGGDTIQISMDKHDTVQLQSAADLTGAHILADKPIAVFSGNVKTRVLDESGDHLVAQLSPVDTWGKQFITVSYPAKSNGDIFRIVASENDTVVDIDREGEFSIPKAGGFQEVMLKSSSAFLVTATKAVQIAQIGRSQQGNDKGDPAMTIVPPTALFTSDYTFTTPMYSGSTGYTNYIYLLVPYDDRRGVHVDDRKISSSGWNLMRNVNPRMGWRRLSLSDETHRVYHETTNVPVGVYLYGHQSLESYALIPGMLLSPINLPCLPTVPVFGDGIDNDCDGAIDEELCTPDNQGKDDDGDGESDEDCALPPSVDGVWGQWGAWMSCDECGGGGLRTRLRTCSDPAPQYGGKACGGESFEFDECSVPCVQVAGGWSDWGVWGACSVTCESLGDLGTRQRYRSCVNPLPLYGGADCQGEATDIQPCDLGTNCPVDGGWTEWSDWTDCSVTCGPGTRVKTRSCSNPEPQFGGADCTGPEVEQEDCMLINCPIDGGWSPWTTWSDCSKTCDEGTRSRSRSCHSPEPQFGGLDCAADSTEVKTCLLLNCPIDGGWSAWTTWSDCSQTCDEGTTSRSRSCDSPEPQFGGLDCGTDAAEVDTCLLVNCPIDGGWSPWTTWSDCSKTCDEGTRSRSRSCDSPEPQHGGLDCAADSAEVEACLLLNCPIDGGWSAWTTWSDCSQTCDEGTIGRSRSCDNPEPQFGGLDCGTDSVEVDTCLLVNCPIDGGWSPWTTWSDCSKTCDEGTRSRSRSCDSPEPQHGGLDCAADSAEVETCLLFNCPIDGGWSPWTTWSDCSQTCDEGTTSRSRSCDNPEPRFGGLDCGTDSVEVDTCLLVNCPIDGGWSAWTTWSDCSMTCDEGTRSRSRSCDNPEPRFGGLDCGVVFSEVENCLLLNCPIDGVWQEWSGWADCTVTCDVGSTYRIRQCTEPQYGGLDCQGDESESRNCVLQDNCPIDGGWSDWTGWSPCSASCGRPLYERRTRACDRPVARYGGLNCVGDNTELEDCSVDCAVDGLWSVWSPWSECSATCASATRSRSRSCDSPAPQFGGNDCDERVDGDSQSGACSVPLCPVDGAWAEWGSWGTCSRTCEEGELTRRRTCTDPVPVAGGEPCPGQDTSTTTCVLQTTCPPPIHGGWSNWTAWTDCSATCGPGVSIRSRDCNSPAPQHGGDQCDGLGKQSTVCNINLCPGSKAPYDVNPRTGVNGIDPYATIPPDTFPKDTYIDKDIGTYEEFYNKYTSFLNTTDYVDMKRDLINDTTSVVCVNYEVSLEGNRLGAFTCPLPFEPPTFTMCCGEKYSEFCCEDEDDDGGGSLNKLLAGLALLGLLLLVILLGVCCWFFFGREKRERKYKVAPEIDHRESGDRIILNEHPFR